MKKTYYLFNPGQLERKDNTLKFTPVVEDGNGEESVGAPRYLPVEDINEFYVFGSLRANSSLFNFLGQKDIAVHFFDYYENYTGSFMPKDSLLSGRMLLAQTSAFQNKKKRLLIAQKFIESAAYNMIKNLQYYNRRGKDMEDIIDIIKGYAAKPDWTTNTDIHNKISQDLEEKLWDIEDEYGVSLDTDKILEKTIPISIRKYGNR